MSKITAESTMKKRVISKALKPKTIISKRAIATGGMDKLIASSIPFSRLNEKGLDNSGKSISTATGIRRKDMDKNVGEYFSSYAEDYQNEFVASCDDDKTGIILHYIKKYSKILERKNKTKFAFDFGCGPGLYIKHIAHLYNKVEGCDIAADLIEKGIHVFCKRFNNVNIFTYDLTNDIVPTKSKKSISCADENPTFGICANVLIVPNLTVREKILQTIYNTLEDNAYVIFVLPSIESALYCNYRMKLTKPKGEEIDPGLVIPDNTPQQAYKIIRGIIDRDDVATKHYVKEEAIHWLNQNKFNVLESSKCCYDWETEYPGEEHVSSWVRNTTPLPFDHVFVCQKQ
jgi:SAM-dependent methyltransferase